MHEGLCLFMKYNLGSIMLEILRKNSQVPILEMLDTKLYLMPLQLNLDDVKYLYLLNMSVMCVCSGYQNQLWVIFSHKMTTSFNESELKDLR